MGNLDLFFVSHILLVLKQNRALAYILFMLFTFKLFYITQNNA